MNPKDESARIASIALPILASVVLLSVIPGDKTADCSASVERMSALLTSEAQESRAQAAAMLADAREREKSLAELPAADVAELKAAIGRYRSAEKLANDRAAKLQRERDGLVCPSWSPDKSAPDHLPKADPLTDNPVLPAVWRGMHGESIRTDSRLVIPRGDLDLPGAGTLLGGGIALIWWWIHGRSNK